MFGIARAKKMQKQKAIYKCKCPRCRQGDMFKNPSYSPKFYEMDENCQCCGLRFQIEPGFYFGAMYFSYAFVVAIVIIESAIIYFLFNDPQMGVYTISSIASVVLLLPLLFRYSRVLFLHLFGGISYNPSVKTKNC